MSPPRWTWEEGRIHRNRTWWSQERWTEWWSWWLVEGGLAGLSAFNAFVVLLNTFTHRCASTLHGRLREYKKTPGNVGKQQIYFDSLFLLETYLSKIWKLDIKITKLEYIYFFYLCKFVIPRPLKEKILYNNAEICDYIGLYHRVCLLLLKFAKYRRYLTIKIASYATP